MEFTVLVFNHPNIFRRGDFKVESKNTQGVFQRSVSFNLPFRLLKPPTWLKFLFTIMGLAARQQYTIKSANEENYLQ